MKRVVACGTVVFVVLFSFAAIPTLARNNPAQPVAGYRPLRPVVKAADVTISPNAPPGWIVVKFRNGVTVDAGQSRLAAAAAVRVRQVFRNRGLGEPEPLISGEVAAIQARRLAAEDRVKMNLPDMSLYFYRPTDDPTLAETVIRELNALDEVETAFFEPRPSVATAPAGTLSLAAPTNIMTTPDFEYGQFYLNSAPDGVGARAAWMLPGGNGSGVRVIDVEKTWNLNHEDLSKGRTAIVIGENPYEPYSGEDHGVAVLGEMAADRNGFGMTGIAYGADIGVASKVSMPTAAAIMQAAAVSAPGDCILIELGAPGPHYNFEWRSDQAGFIAVEYWQDSFDAILNAYGAGVIVCEAAGNGGEDFDDPMYESRFDTTFRNSHAIVCGAGYAPSELDRSKADFSNWGARVNLQGYSGSVWTLGYGDLYDSGINANYTSQFGGTSAASPIVTGSVMCLSGVFQQMFGTFIDADSARSLLVATGSPQQEPWLERHIGPRPNLQAALGLLFDPTDSVWYGDVRVAPGARVALPVTLSNSHPVNDIYLPFALTGTPPISIDSLTRGPRTAYFESLQLEFDDRGAGRAGFRLRADGGGGSPYLGAGTGVVANLWVTAAAEAASGEVKTVDTAVLGDTMWLRLVSAFDDGRPDAFVHGTITVDPSACDCPHHGDLNGDGWFTIIDVVGVVGIAFRHGTPALIDPGCPHATRADYNCDGVIDVRDVVRAVDVTFRAGVPPCAPCQTR